MSFIFLLASLSILGWSWSCHADMIADICSQSHTISPVTCARTLRSDPRSRGAYLNTLGQIAIKKAKVAVKNTATVAKSVTNLNNMGAVSVCVRVCSSAIDDLNTIAEMLKHSDKSHKNDIPITLSAAATFVETCDDTFAENLGGEPAEVKEASTIAQGLILVVLIIAGMLP
ncbi:uncharacterized protein LOC131002446 [Salvia miltiorrhiza]|uniref:uncharacterized protein LOC131002446 n=1 Tax=Salvia miltiorrhiza TaxID=226208 RepID=UPI0025AD04DD|nr:uncharacterized protein LOC131002446 [Salvia miltiorrhiza]